MTDTTIDDEPGNSARARRARDKVVDDLVAEGTITSASIEAAMRKVPRELFAPEVGLDEVYHPHRPVVTKRDANGNATSSVSAPQLQAHMLQQAEIGAGMRVLEVGSGGCNAALMAELVGHTGQVTTVDIDPDITDRARRLLDEAGYSRVQVVLADADGGVPEYAPYDGILVTAGAWEIPPAWVDQLAEGGCLLVPLSVLGLSRTIAFEKTGGCLVSRSATLFGFVPLQGAGAHESTRLVLRGGEVSVHLDDVPPAEFPVDPSVLERALDTPRVEVWSGATIGRFEPWATTQMWLATALPGFGRVVVDRERDTGLICPPGRHIAAVGTVSGGTLAYVTTRSTADDQEVEFGVHAFGPNAAELAEVVAGQLRIWARDHRGGPGPQFRVCPSGTPDDRLLPGGRVVDKPRSRISICWPQAVTAARSQNATEVGR